MQAQQVISSYQEFKHAMDTIQAPEHGLTLIDRLLAKRDPDSCGWILYYLQKRYDEHYQDMKAIAHFVAVMIIQYYLQKSRQHNPCLDVLWGLLELGVFLTPEAVRMVCDEDDPDLLRSILEFPQVCSVVDDGLISYVFGNENLDHDYELCQLLEEAYAKKS